MNQSGTLPSYHSTTMKNEISPDEPPSPSMAPAPKQSLYDRVCNNAPFQISCRVLQCLSCIVSLVLFALRLHRLAQHLVDLSTSNGAVMGILAAAVVYTLTSMLIRHVLKNGGPMWLRFVWLAADVAFVVAFIMVAELTAPGRDMTSGPCHTSLTVRTIQGAAVNVYNALNCKLPLGTFILAIFST